MVVFVNGDKASKEYRRFKIRTKDTPDDFHMMREMLSRRLRNKTWTSPQLLVIDGGKGQVGAALKALANMGERIPVVGLAKREETIVVPLKKPGGIEFVEIKLPYSTPGINLLRRIRDEAHRFAVTYHRLLRKKAMLPS
jgi:excinuclease ABC subunit C